MNILRDCMFRKINFAGSDGLIFVKSMPNERQQHNASVDSSLFDVKSDVSTETLPTCVKQAGSQLTENTDMTERAL